MWNHPCRASINHSAMFRHHHVSHVCWVSTYHEFLGPVCVLVYLPSYGFRGQGDYMKSSIVSFHKSFFSVPSPLQIINVLGSHPPCILQLCLCLGHWVLSWAGVIFHIHSQITSIPCPFTGMHHICARVPLIKGLVALYSVYVSDPMPFHGVGC